MKIKIRDEYFQLSIEEFYVYCWLRKNMNYEAQYYTTLGLIVASVDILKKKQSNKQKVTEILTTLKTKGIIDIDHDVKSIGQHVPMRIKFACSGDIRSRYTNVDSDMFVVNNPQYFFVLATILKWKGVGDKQFSLEEWAETLGVSIKTVQKIMNEMEDAGYINIRRGSYYETEKGLKQEMNQYYLGDMWKRDDAKKVSATSEKVEVPLAKPVQAKKNGVVGSNVNLIFGKYTDKRLLERDNLIRDGADLTDYDFEIYLTTNDMELKKRAEYRFYQQIGKKEAGLKFVNDSLRRVERMLAEKKNKRQQADVMSSMPPPDKQMEYMIEDTAKEVYEEDEPRETPWMYEDSASTIL